MKRAYLDYAATTPIDKAVLAKMKPYLMEKYGNPSSIHQWGQEARQAIDKAREQVANFLNCKTLEIIFTGSATESDNLAIRGLLGDGHVITTEIEHKAILETCKNFKSTYLSVNKDGLINLKELEKAIKPDTKLVSIMYVNNETGVVQPIKKVGEMIAKINKSRKKKPSTTANSVVPGKIYFHTDAAQATSWFKLDVNKLKVDLLTLSGHKIYAPKGIGVLYIKQGTPIKSLITGGDHELGLRAGTENVANIVGMAEAIQQISNFKFQISKKIEKLREKLVKEVLKIPGSKLNGPTKKENRTPHIANFSFKGIEGEGLVIALDQDGIGASTGSACSSSELKPSHVLMAMGLSELEAHSSLRISLGKYTTTREIDYFLKILPKVIDRLRKISGR